MIESNVSPQTSIAGLKGMGGKKGKGSLKAGLFAKFLALFQKHMGKGGLGKGAQNAQAVQKSQTLQKSMAGKQAGLPMEPGQGLALMVQSPGLKGGEIKFSSMGELQVWLQNHPDAVVMMEPESGSDASIAEAFTAAMEEIDVENELTNDSNGLGDEASVVRDSSTDILVGLSLVSREKISNVMSLQGEKNISSDGKLDVLVLGKEKNVQGEKGQAYDQTRQQTEQSSMPLDRKGISQVSAADGKVQQLIAKASGLPSSIESDGTVDASSGRMASDMNQPESVVKKQDKIISDVKKVEVVDVKKNVVEIPLQANAQRVDGETGSRTQQLTSKLEAMGQLLADTDANRVVNEKPELDVKIATKAAQQMSDEDPLKGKRIFDSSADLPAHLAQLKLERNGVSQQQLQAAQVVAVDRGVGAIASDHGLGTSQQDLGSSQQDSPTQLLVDNAKADNKTQRAADFAAQLAYKTPKAFKPADAMLEIARSARDGSVKIELQLDPANLGKIQVTLQTDAAKQLQVHFAVDQAMSRQALEQNMPQLRQALAEQGLDLGSFSMSMNSQGQGGDSQGSERSGEQGAFSGSLGQNSMGSSENSVRMGVNLANDGGLSLLA